MSAELALGYWLFAFLSALGALQWVATRYRLRGLAFVDCTLSHAGGYALAAILVVGSAAGFFITQWRAIFAPGPAGSELAVLFGTSAICALALTLILAPLLVRWRRGVTLSSGGGDGQPVSIGHATGRLYVPPGQTTLAPAICLLPACPVGAARMLPGGAGGSSGVPPVETTEVTSMAILARRLAGDGLVVLVVNPDEQSYAYPAILATLPAAVAALRERPEVDPNRIGALGEDLGGDLVIRAASTSKEIKAVAALAPILANVPPGLGLLSEMSYLQALRWARDRKRANLCKELNAVAYGARIPPRPFLLLYGERDRVVGSIAIAGAQLQVIPGLGHLHLTSQPVAMQVVSAWLREHL